MLEAYCTRGSRKTPVSLSPIDLTLDYDDSAELLLLLARLGG